MADTPTSARRGGWRTIAAFGGVGLTAYITDLTVFNLLRLGPLEDKVVTAKIVATIIATAVAFIGNRTWVFTGSPLHPTRQLVRFLLINAAAAAVTVATLAISHYILGFTSALADNISGNIIGVALGTIVRYVGYNMWAFPHGVPEDPAAQSSHETNAAPTR